MVDMSAPIASHWDEVYAGRPGDSFAWWEPQPSTLPVVLAWTEPSMSLIDVGGGTSRLVERLLERGYRDLSVVDLSGEALESHRRALGPSSGDVEWIHQDVLALDPERTWRCWHDRATFHFLTRAADRHRYVALAARAVSEGGIVIVATFAEDGPASCAGLPVCRYSVESLAAEFEPEFALVDGGAIPPTADGDQRPYEFVVLRHGVADGG